MLYDVDKTNVGTYSFIKLNMIVLPIFAYYLIVNIFSYPLSPIPICVYMEVIFKR